MTSGKEPANLRFPIVALGASAGGLEALIQFFDHVPADSGVAFIIVTHQQANRTSLLPGIVAKHTQMPVTEAKDGDRLEPNHVLVAPSSGLLEVFHGTLQLTAASEPPHLPIDSFFRSLALDQQERAIAIILSGTGTDGTLGIRAIKGESGMVMVQDPTSAKHEGMVQSAIATGLADYVQSAAELPSKLMLYVSRNSIDVLTKTTDDLAGALPKIFWQLRARTGHDFSSYKPNTIRRRILRRMNVHQIDNPLMYVNFLQDNPYEIDQLFKELLITVTSFFRDPEAFDALKAQVASRFESSPEDESFRAWVPGCATGEEAYSVAIVIHECLSAVKKNIDVQVFATDLDEAAIDMARIGRYSEGIASDMDAQRLQRYFTKEDNGYRISKSIREMVVFATQNMIKDPPFTKLNLLTCRNVLIYLNRDLQERLLPIFHYSLLPNGLLMLGSSETVGASADLFNVKDNKWKIYSGSESTTSIIRQPEFQLSSGRQEVLVNNSAVAKNIGVMPRKATDLLKEHLLSTYVPPTVIVDERGDIIHVQGKTGLYLELPTGQMSSNLFEMARGGLPLDLAAAVRHANATDQPIVHNNILLKSNGDDLLEVNISVERISSPEPIRGLLRVTFAPAFPNTQNAETEGAEGTEGTDLNLQEGRFERLERELQFMKETLQSAIHQSDTANEELKSANEELQSTNEELQSANEELETSKEEMQSLNEELQTVNAELSTKLDELSHSNDDMQNLLNSTEIATLFLDNNMQIKRYAKSATRVFKVREVDVGRSLNEIVHDLDYQNLVDDAKNVLETLVFKEKEILSRDANHAYRVRIQPYRTSENVIDGVVITLIDIKEICESRDYAESIIATISEPFIVLDEALQVVSSNSAFYDRFQLTKEAIEGRPVGDLRTGQWDMVKLQELLASVLPEDSSFEGFEIAFDFPENRNKKMYLSGRRLAQSPERPGLVLLSFKEASDST